MSEINIEDCKMNYVYIVFIGKQVFRDNCERLYNQEILKVFFCQEKANVYAKNIIQEKLGNQYNENELDYTNENLFHYLCMNNEFYENNGFHLKLWVQKHNIVDSTFSFSI